jgi:hypothetical protein
MRAQASAKGVHGFEHILIDILTKVLLPDRKNGLALVEMLVKQGTSFLFHF